ncbi:MAG TPA: hypothetical protein VL068_14345, partial [Microthrixaceae bacterium]|nr:hypothetical protein [Microthrixaceae bacterium]
PLVAAKSATKHPAANVERYLGGSTLGTFAESIDRLGIGFYDLVAARLWLARAVLGRALLGLTW